MNTKFKVGSFTLIEILVASAGLVVIVTMTLSGFIYVLKGTNEALVQNELDLDVQKTMERLKRDLRLSSLNKIIYYPAGAGPYEAISFPLANADPATGAILIDTNGNILWNKTLIYHVWPNVPNELRLTTFEPQTKDSLSDAQLYAQLQSVVLTGNASNAPNGTNATTRSIFANLFTWNIESVGGVYDGYAANTTRHVNAYLGSCLITSGINNFKFTIISSNKLSSGYKIGIDSMIVTPSYGKREGEGQTSIVAGGSPSPVLEYMRGGTWNGNYHLVFPATDSGQEFTLKMSNDCWEQTNFRESGELHENTTVIFDTNMTPMDFVVCLNGSNIGWSATEQTEDSVGSAVSLDVFKGYAVRVLLKGEQMAPYGNWIEYNAGKCRVNFKGGPEVSRKLQVDIAYIGISSDQLAPSMDVVPGSLCQLTFGAALSPSTQVLADTNVWSNWADFPIVKSKSYIVSYYIANATAWGNPWQWSASTNVNICSYYIPAAFATPADISIPVWSNNPNVFATSCVYGVQYLDESYPSNGTYTSQIIDTHLTTPEYSMLDWNAQIPDGITMKIRSGSNRINLADAPAWSNVAPMTVPGLTNPGSYRYVQFQASLETTNPACLQTPKLKDVTVRWKGEPKIVDISGTFTKGPEYGIFKLTVNDVSLQKGIKVNLEIFKDTVSYGGITKRITSSLSSEVVPRNTGR